MRPVVSMKVRWMEMEEERRGIEVSYFTLLEPHFRQLDSTRESAIPWKKEITYVAPSGKMTRICTRSYSIPSGCFGPSRNGTLSA